MDIDAELSRAGLTRETYEQVMSDIRDKLEGVQDLEWTEIIEKYNLQVKPEKLRKSQAKPFGGAFASEYYASKSASSSHLEQLAEIRKEKQKLSDERAAIRKISRTDARYEQDMEYLGKLIQERGFPMTSRTPAPMYKSDNDLLISCHDVHYGLDISNNFGEFNSDIVARRMHDYTQRILEIQKMHGSQNAWILLGGDLISGVIHNSVQLQNRENVVEQIQGVSELISLFAYELSGHFDHVYVNGTCGGNHSRVNQNKEDVLRGERLDLLVPWYIEARLSVVPNIDIINDSIDPSIALMVIRGKYYAGVHGDSDKFAESGVHKLQTIIGLDRPLEAIIMGHLHHCSYDDVAGVKLVRSGSFCDPIDDYSINKRLVGHASQMVMVVDSNGIKTFYPVDLK